MTGAGLRRRAAPRGVRGLRGPRAPRFLRAAAAAALLAAGPARAAGAHLSIQEAQASEKGWPEARVFVEVVGASGAPIRGLGPELFQVYEAGSPRSAKILKVQALEDAQAGASVVVVLQASGSWMGIEDGVRKALADFVQGLASHDRVAIVTDAGDPKVLAGFSGDRGAATAALAQVGFTDPSFLLYDAAVVALSLLDGPGAALQAGGEAAPAAPPPRAIVVVADGRDNGSVASAERVIAGALRRRIPVHAVGHSELDADGLPALEQLAARTGGAYRPAPAVEDLGPALAAVRDRIDQTYAIAWRSALPHDGREHPIEVAMENEGGAPLRGKLALRTPRFTDWRWLGVGAAVLLAACGAGAAGYLLARGGGSRRACRHCRGPLAADGACPACQGRGSRARLTVRTGAAAGRSYPVAGSELRLGSGPGAAVRLLDAAVSGNHAAIRAAGGGFEIEDLGSRNGVLVNGRRTGRCALRDGDVITLGTTELGFSLVDG
ncbi:MAG: hypothetical protein NVSMB23_25870 [Myxococcales bacterium]